MGYIADPRADRQQLLDRQANELLAHVVDALAAGLRPEQIRDALQCRSMEFFSMAEFLRDAEHAASDLTAGGNLRTLPGGGGCDHVGSLAAAQLKVISICAILRQTIWRIGDDPKVELALIDQRPSRN